MFLPDVKRSVLEVLKSRVDGGPSRLNNVKIDVSSIVDVFSVDG